MRGKTMEGIAARRIRDNSGTTTGYTVMGDFKLPNGQMYYDYHDYNSDELKRLIIANRLNVRGLRIDTAGRLMYSHKQLVSSFMNKLVECKNMSRRMRLVYDDETNGEVWENSWHYRFDIVPINPTDKKIYRSVIGMLCLCGNINTTSDVADIESSHLLLTFYQQWEDPNEPDGEAEGPVWSDIVCPLSSLVEDKKLEYISRVIHHYVHYNNLEHVEDLYNLGFYEWH